MRVLIVTNMWPTAEKPWNGIFVKEQMDSLASLPNTECHVLYPKRTKGPLSYAELAFRLQLHLQKNSYDIIHAHYGLTGAAAGAALTRTPLVVTLHGSDVNIEWQLRYSRFACRRAKKVIAVSRQVQLASGYDADVIPCGVDLDLFRPIPQAEARTRLGLPSDVSFVLFGGTRADPLKAFFRFEEAMRLLDASQIRLLELGKVSRSDMPYWMAASDVLVLTSLQEGSPQVVKEAIACGLPIVSVPIGDVEEMVAGLPECRIVEPIPNQIAEAIKEVASQRKRMQVPRSRLEKISLTSIASQIREVYRRIVQPTDD